MDAAPTTPFHVVTNGAGGRIEVDGTDVTALVAGVELVVGFDQPSRLVLHRNAVPGTIEGDAIIEVATPGGDPADAVRALDPAVLRQRMLASPIDMATDTYAAMLEHVAAMLDETGPWT